AHQLPRHGPDHLRVFPERECHLSRRLAETRPLEPERVGLYPRHIEYRRRDVDRLDRIGDAPAPGLAGKLHDQRDMDLGFVERIAVRPRAVLAEALPMVRSHDDQRALEQPLAPQSVEELAERLVQIAYLGVVEVD